MTVKPEYANIAILDYKSLYPYTMVRNNISFDTIRIKILGLTDGYSELYARQELAKLILPNNPTAHELSHFYKYTGTGRTGSKLFGLLYALDKELLLKRYGNVKAKVELIGADYSVERKTLTFGDLYALIQENEYNVAFNGAVFESKELGIVPRTEMEFVQKRDEYKALLKKTDNELERLIYDIIQRAYKVMANAGFGASGNPAYFGFDPYIFEAITLTAQYYSIVGTYVLNEYIVHRKKPSEIPINVQSFIIGKSEYGRNQQQIALYTDTDSIILYLRDVVPDPQERIQLIETLADTFNNEISPILVKQLVINEDYYKLAEEYNPKFKVEFIGSRALFTSGKKRYVILDAQYTDESEDALIEQFDKAFKVAGFETVKEVTSEMYKHILRKFFVYVLKGKLNLYNKLSVQTFLNKLKEDIKYYIEQTKQKILANQNSTESAELLDEILQDIADSVAWKRTKHTYVDFIQLLDEVTPNKVQQILKAIPSHVLMMMAYNTVRQTAIFTPGSKGLGFKTKCNRKLISDLTKVLRKKGYPLTTITAITQKLMSSNIFVSAYGDVEYLLGYMDWNNLLPQIHQHIARRLQEIIEDVTSASTATVLFAKN